MTCHIPNIIAFPLTSRALGAAEPAQKLRRPRSLIRAAQAGQSLWKRGRDLPRLLRCEALPGHDTALALLHQAESAQNAARLARRPDYDMHRHVLLMVAILAEMRAQRARNSDPSTPRTSARPA
ncbi:DUF6477 family protein [Paracoccus jiaweipingae]|uniref:DUF6477 family protein n=1 Tax=unclassified Paracoccus (in: a-proteobacteria) TaxID=2688777 RepID=UPI0037AEBD2B